jgi:hypothetical protein
MREIYKRRKESKPNVPFARKSREPGFAKQNETESTPYERRIFLFDCERIAAPRASREEIAKQSQSQNWTAQARSLLP